MRISAIAALAALGLVASAGAANSAVIASSNFNTGADGWSYGSINATALVIGPAGWNAGGHLETTDVAEEVAFFAPGGYLGDLSSAYGGAFKFDITSALNDVVPYTALVLYGAGQAISIGHAPPSTSDFETFSFSLTEAGWLTYSSGGLQNGSAVSLATFQAVLANVTAIGVHADWNTGEDFTKLDNVMLTDGRGLIVDIPDDEGPPSLGGPIPEPATWALMIGGFGLAGGMIRRRRALALA